MSEAGGDIAKLPTVVAAGERVGSILPEMADACGLPRGVAVVAGTTDGCAAFLHPVQGMPVTARRRLAPR